MTTDQKRAVLRQLAHDQGDTFRTDYSGRYMYGATCVGIVTSTPRDLIAEARAAGIRGERTDDMGKRTIVYWPRIPAEVTRRLTVEEALDTAHAAISKALKARTPSNIHRRLVPLLELLVAIEQELDDDTKALEIDYDPDAT